jgi:hypothetical protein
MAAAKTGNARSNKNAVTKTDHANKGILYIAIPRDLMFNTVTIKFMAPKIEEAPLR